jgi:HAD superfamily hydrolase (TIGR01662 family)
MKYNGFVFDLDYTIVGTHSGKICPENVGDVVLLPNVRPVFEYLKGHGKKIFIVTNQGGVSCGFKNEYGFWEIIGWLYSKLPNMIDYVNVCFYHPDGEFRGRYTDRRKPNPAMIDELINSKVSGFIQRPECIFIGDGKTDQAAAKNAGVAFEWAHTFFCWPKSHVVEDNFGYRLKRSFYVKHKH